MKNIWKVNKLHALRSYAFAALGLFSLAALSGCDGADLNGSSEPVVPTTSLSISQTGSFVAGACNRFSVSNLDGNGALAAVSADTPVQLSVTGSGALFSDSICVTSLGSNLVTISAGSSSVAFFFKDSLIEHPTVTASATNDPNITQGSSGAITVNPTLAFTTTPSAESGCVNFGTAPVVTAQDGSGSTVTNFSGTVSIAAYTDAACTSAASGALTGNSVAASSGVATFSSFKYPLSSSSSSQIYLQATSSSSGTSSCVGPVTVSSSAANKLAFSVQPPATVVEAVAFAPAVVVAVQDACGFTKTSAVNPVTLTAKGDAACATAYSGGTFAGGTATAASSGLASFATVSETKTGNLYIQATAAGLTSSCSTVTAVTGGTATKFLVSTTTYPALNTCSPAITVTLSDSNGNATTKGGAQTVNLAVTGSAALYSDVTCATPAASISIPANTSTGSFYVKDAVSETIVSTASDPGAVPLTSATISEYVTTWTTIASYQGVAGKNCTTLKAQKGASGAFYALNAQNNATGSQIEIWKSTDDGVTWSKIFSYAPTATSTVLVTSTSGIDVSREASGILYVTFGVTDGSGVGEWDTFTTANSGATWTEIDTAYHLNATYASQGSGVAYDAGGGYLYVAGNGADSGGVLSTVVRRSSNGGSSWDNTYTSQYSAGKSSQARDIMVDGAGNVYLSVLGIDGSNHSHWVVMRSTDHGLTFNIVDDFVYSANQVSKTYSLSMDGLGNIWAAGYGVNAGGTFTLLERMSTTGNAGTWSTFDGFQYTAGQSTQGRQFLDKNGDGTTLYVAGGGKGPNGAYNWVVRKSTNSGTSWSTVDFYTGDYAQTAQINESLALLKRSDGKIAVFGYHEIDTTGVQYCAVRRE